MLLKKNDSTSGRGWELDRELHAPSALSQPVDNLQVEYRPHSGLRLFQSH